ncbi:MULTISPECIES: class I SAM-dependent methyltransferase [unclassified Staphylococcus]|uniref:class I SAM-dependent methyltransferase n=1 Tax=unclassified Staphylococcus TaxID=91994 RepID=UPI0021D1C71B|nr:MULTISPECIES: class I SAM-dependent methyltransferase [unclassified Staphylococcus]UXR77799.1 class I SAM-dependent methyltransferase [Staphylococcus sp. IVB6227]UXR81958.1 class I SAM-dependent methyltransferase [Staphylococcus sp. IVB6214]
MCKDKKFQLQDSKTYMVKSDKDDTLVVLNGRLAIIRENDIDNKRETFLLGVGEIYIVEKGFKYFIKSLIIDTRLKIADTINITVINKESLENIFSEIDDYYFGYEERYKKVYESGADLWETVKPNKSLIKIFDEYNKIFRENVIDLGCGEGRDTIFLSENNVDVKGVDISHSAINKAKQKIRERNGNEDIFQTGNVLYLNQFENQSFHLAMNMGCLHMMKNPEDRLIHIKNVHRILVNGGYFLVDHCKDEWGKGFHTIENYNEVKEKLKNFNEENYIDRIITVNGEKIKIPLKVIPYMEKSSKELINEITSNGFNVVEVYHNNTESFGNSVLVLFKKR